MKGTARGVTILRDHAREHVRAIRVPDAKLINDMSTWPSTLVDVTMTTGAKWMVAPDACSVPFGIILARNRIMVRASYCRPWWYLLPAYVFVDRLSRCVAPTKIVKTFFATAPVLRRHTIYLRIGVRYRCLQF